MGRLLIANSLKKNLEIDLGAEMIIAAQKHTIEIAVEIKSFIGKSEVHDFYKALGQFRTYLRIMKKTDPKRILFLAVPIDAYTTFFSSEFGQEAIDEENLPIVVYDSIKRTIVLWIK